MHADGTLSIHTYIQVRNVLYIPPFCAKKRQSLWKSEYCTFLRAGLNPKKEKRPRLALQWCQPCSEKLILGHEIILLPRICPPSTQGVTEDTWGPKRDITYINTCMQMEHYQFIRTYKHAYKPQQNKTQHIQRTDKNKSYTFTYMHTYVYKCTHTYKSRTHTYMHACMHAYKHMHVERPLSHT